MYLEKGSTCRPTESNLTADITKFKLRDTFVCDFLCRRNLLSFILCLNLNEGYQKFIMRVGCVICGDLFVVSDDISATPCGHTFHAVCLIQWIERSKSCPQCRHKVTQKSILKLFFDSSSSSDTQVDPDTLQFQIDNMKFQIRLKEQEIIKLKEDNSCISKRNSDLREEYKTLERKLKDKETTNMALKTQLKYLDELKIKADRAEEKSKILKSQLSVLQDVQLIVSGTNEDVEVMLMSHADSGDSARSLATFCSFLKREMSKAVDDKKRIRNLNLTLKSDMKDLQSSYNTVSEKLDTYEQVNKQLQDDILSLELDNQSLRKKIGRLEEAIASPSGNVKNSALHRLIAESPAPEKLKRPLSSHSDEDDIIATPEIVRQMALMENLDDSIEYIGTSKQPNIIPSTKKIALPGRKPFAVTSMSHSHRLSHDIFAKRKASSLIHGKSQSTTEAVLHDDIGYDGLGGHHKVCEFPIPKPAVFVPKKASCKKSSQTTLKIVSNSGGKVQKTTLRDFFQNTFDD
ncbi:hypothetical protein SK128_027439 [Halocaridina rubra]|uniref:RING-type domain-containing protein n=1 Tax=Halocaridina rubra TaxID=373956 RepID=A0AAN9A293_HALRR